MNTDKRIYVIDNDASVRSKLIDILKKKGFTDIHEASEGVQALENYFHIFPDFVYANITLPNLDGLDLIKAMKTFDRTLRVIALTRPGEERKVKDAWNIKIVRFVKIPFTTEEILEPLYFYLGE